MSSSSSPCSLSSFLILHLAWLCHFPSQAEPDRTVPEKPSPTGRHCQPVPTGSEGGSQVGMVLGKPGLVLEGWVGRLEECEEG